MLLSKNEQDTLLIETLTEFIEKKRNEYEITMDALCHDSHISKKMYIAFRRGQRQHVELVWFLRLVHGLNQQICEEDYQCFWQELGKAVIGIEMPVQ